jgi:hypothetical protein
MSLWTERILQEFTADLARLWVVADPDGVLLDEQILTGLRARGFEVLPFEDSIVFRAEYEERFRVAWARGEAGAAKALVLHLRGSDVAALPWDYLRQGRRVSLSLADLFPQLSYSVVRQLGEEYHEPLFAAQARYVTQALGEAATKEFVLTHIFRLSPHLISRSEELWRELLRLHYRDKGLPKLLAQHMAQVLEAETVFRGLPIGALFSTKSVLLRVVQEAWGRYLAQFGLSCARVNEPALGEYPSTAGAPIEVPFAHPDVRVVVDSMFLEGTLQPVVVQGLSQDLPEWAQVGVIQDPAARQNLVQEGVRSLLETLPAEGASYRDWIQFARRQGEVLARYQALDSTGAEKCKASIVELQKASDKALLSWLALHYSDLSSLPTVKGPVLVHHIPRFLSLRRGGGETKIALLVFDGLALDQWSQIRENLTQQAPGLGFEENACFAWLPTLTSVSRQALFSGLKPREFADTIETTAKEPEQWQHFWQEQGMRPNEVFYRKGLKRAEQLAELDSTLSKPTLKIAGIVVDTVDEIVHGAVLGKRGIASQIGSWCESGFVARLFELLLAKGFHVYLTADHGNVEAVGQGRPNQGVMAELRGERVRVYRTEGLCADSAHGHPNTQRLDVAGLPANFLPLFAGERTAFVPIGEQLVAHGGVSVEELLVPFVKVGYIG